MFVCTRPGCRDSHAAAAAAAGAATAATPSAAAAAATAAYPTSSGSRGGGERGCGAGGSRPNPVRFCRDYVSTGKGGGGKDNGGNN